MCVCVCFHKHIWHRCKTAHNPKQTQEKLKVTNEISCLWRHFKQNWMHCTNVLKVILYKFLRSGHGRKRTSMLIKGNLISASGTTQVWLLPDRPGIINGVIPNQGQWVSIKYKNGHFFQIKYSFFFFHMHLWHVEVPGPGVEAAAGTYATALATPGPSHTCGLRCSLRECKTLNPMSEASQRLCWVLNLLSHKGSSQISLYVTAFKRNLNVFIRLSIH